MYVPRLSIGFHRYIHAAHAPTTNDPQPQQAPSPLLPTSLYSFVASSIIFKPISCFLQHCGSQLSLSYVPSMLPSRPPGENLHSSYHHAPIHTESDPQCCHFPYLIDEQQKSWPRDKILASFAEMDAGRKLMSMKIAFVCLKVVL